VGGARRLVEVLDGWASGALAAVPQDDALATYAPQIQRSDALIDWSRPAVEIWRAVRAYHPWPVAYTTYAGQELRVHESWPLASGSSAAPGEPGTVLSPTPLPPSAGSQSQAFSVQTGDGALAVLRLQRQGGRPMSGMDFLRGQRDFVGARLGL
jgi:methionyl-tRNA formyltransferase